MVMKKELALYERDEDGKLIPKEVKVEIDETDDLQLEYAEETIFVTPMSRGEIKKIFSQVSAAKDDEDLDGKLIVKHCKNPAFDIKEVDAIKPALATIIVNTIFRESGVSLGKNTKKKAIQEAEDDFAKN